MNSFSQNCNNIFDLSVNNYHITDDVDAQITNPFAEKWVGVNYKPTEKEPYCDIRRTYGSEINAY